jgi:hypothetical protein
MKRDLSQEILDLDGNTLPDKPTLKTLCFAVLTAQLEGDQNLAVDAKMKQYALLQAVNAGGVIELTAEDIALFKGRAAKSLPLIGFGRLCELLEREYREPPDLKVVEPPRKEAT